MRRSARTTISTWAMTPTKPRPRLHHREGPPVVCEGSWNRDPAALAFQARSTGAALAARSSASVLCMEVPLLSVPCLHPREVARAC